MTSPKNNLNRPVHLARRDAFFERAMDILCQPADDLLPEQRLRHVEMIQDALRRAHDHAFSASQSDRASEGERSFQHFLELKLQNVTSAIAMIRHQLELEQEAGFLSQFLNTTPQEAALPARQYERRAQDILQGVWQMLRHAHATYFELRNDNQGSLLPEEINRYHRAYSATTEEAKRRLSTIAPGEAETG